MDSIYQYGQYFISDNLVSFSHLYVAREGYCAFEDITANSNKLRDQHILKDNNV